MMSASRFLFVVALVAACVIAPITAQKASEFNSNAALKSLVEKIEATSELPAANFIDLMVKAKFWTQTIPTDGYTAFVPSDTALTATDVTNAGLEADAVSKCKRYFVNDKKWTKTKITTDAKAADDKKVTIETQQQNAPIIAKVNGTNSENLYLNDVAKITYETTADSDKITINLIDKDIPLVSAANMITLTCTAVLGAFLVTLLN